MIPYSEEQRRVNDFLERGGKRQKYRRLQESVKNFFSENVEHAQIYGSISNVFSRADADSEYPIKSNKKIAMKLHKWRQSGKSVSPAEIHDICGVTVVCFYPSDLEKVVHFIESRKEQEFFSFESKHLKPPLTGPAYTAYHYTVRGKAKYHDLLCEVQLKTVLTQAWGTKTHDLTYKPAGKTDSRFSDHVNKLGYNLQIIDQQSEILKDLITEAWSMDLKRRRVARTQMLQSISSLTSPEMTTLIDYINQNEEELAKRDLSNPVVSEFERMLSDRKNTAGLDMNLCRVAGIYAITRDAADRNSLALDYIDELIDSIDEGSEPRTYRKLIIQKSVVAMALGEYADAIECGRWLVEQDKMNHAPELPISALANLAYFLSEAAYHRYYDYTAGGGDINTDGTESCRKEAMEIIVQLSGSELPEKYQTQIQDTIGAVKICCGLDETTVKDGLAQCKEAMEDCSDAASKRAVIAFYDLHEKRAYRRILELSNDR
ncbi:MAG: RelA/SpoT domain-containing protein [Henriciella sp.]|nr:RelA/SpoT domain-containing protein [Henriciella sp.]